MLKFIWRLLLWLRGETLKLLLTAGVILIIWGITSPVGTLIWWLGQSADTLGFKKNRPEGLPSSESTLNKPSPTKEGPSANFNCYLIFLPGVGDFSADELTVGEELFLKQLVKQHPNCVAVGDIFPYSAANKSLGGQRFLSPMWRYVEKAKSRWISGDIFIKIRNLWRFAISLDSRYGPVYNQGIATAIIERMDASHPIQMFSEKPLQVILIGTSGGAQVALGATPYLKQWLNANITVVSIGGVFSGRNGFNAADRVFHLRGKRDPIDNIGGIVFPSRWPINVGSPFNHARWQGRYSESVTGPHKHDGEQGYFGTDLLGNGSMYVDLTLQHIHQLPIWNESQKQ